MLLQLFDHLILRIYNRPADLTNFKIATKVDRVHQP